MLIDTAQPVLMGIGIIVATAGIAAMAGPQAALIADVFPARVRYSGASSAYQIGSVLGGAVAPLAATALFAAYGSSMPVAIYMGAMGLITFVSMAALVLPSVRPTPATATVTEKIKS